MAEPLPRDELARGGWVCAACGYDVRALIGATCPECGADLTCVGVRNPHRRWWPPVIPGAVLVAVAMLAASAVLLRVVEAGRLAITPRTGRIAVYDDPLTQSTGVSLYVHGTWWPWRGPARTVTRLELRIPGVADDVPLGLPPVSAAQVQDAVRVHAGVQLSDRLAEHVALAIAEATRPGVAEQHAQRLPRSSYGTVFVGCDNDIVAEDLLAWWAVTAMLVMIVVSARFWRAWRAAGPRLLAPPPGP